MLAIRPTFTGPVLPVSDPALRALHAAAMIVAAVAEPQDRYQGVSRPTLEQLDDETHDELAALTPHDRSWQNRLAQLVTPLSHQDAAVIGACLATSSPQMAPETLTTGRVQRRLDAVLDVLDTPFSASDVQYAQQENTATIAEVAIPPLLQGATLAVALVGGAHGILSAGRHAERGATWLAGRTGVPVTLLDELAAGLTQTRAALTSPDPDLTPVVALNAAWLEALHAAGADVAALRRGEASTLKTAARRCKARADALGILRASVNDGALPFDHRMPDLSGHRLSDAKTLLTLHGISSGHKDGGSGERWVASDANWRVASQSPAAGTADVEIAMLTVLKWSE
jgi:hypothetical protein